MTYRVAIRCLSCKAKATGFRGLEFTEQLSNYGCSTCGVKAKFAILYLVKK